LYPVVYRSIGCCRQLVGSLSLTDNLDPDSLPRDLASLQDPHESQKEQHGDGQ
jgi:hypothetical protein